MPLETNFSENLDKIRLRATSSSELVWQYNEEIPSAWCQPYPPEKELKDIFYKTLLYIYNIYVYIRYFINKIINTLI